MATKDNRKVALSMEYKALGKYTNITSLGLEENVKLVYVAQLDFPVALTKQVFKNGDGSTGVLYLASSDVNLSFLELTTIYTCIERSRSKKRWQVEAYHTSIKSNASFAKSPTKTVITQISHFIASIKAYVKLELLKIRLHKNHFTTKAHLILEANKKAY
jgi:kynureninase